MVFILQIYILLVVFTILYFLIMIYFILFYSIYMASTLANPCVHLNVAGIDYINFKTDL